jgi:hypothetical protein
MLGFSGAQLHCLNPDLEEHDKVEGLSHSLKDGISALNRLLLPATFLLCLLLGASFSPAATKQNQRPPTLVENGLPIVFEPAGENSLGGASMVGRPAGLTMGFGPGILDVGFQGKQASHLEIESRGASSTVPGGTDFPNSLVWILLGIG